MRGLNEVYSGGLGSYGLTLFITSFLQMHPRVQSGAIREEENLGVLLIQLLELYGKRFSYETVGISTKYHEYFRKGEYGRLNTLPHEASRAVVEDPDDESKIE
jgi:non-canonical poly(A) RNA polymerase PAPD5/7